MPYGGKQIWKKYVINFKKKEYWEYIKGLIRLTQAKKIMENSYSVFTMFLELY